MFRVTSLVRRSGTHLSQMSSLMAGAPVLSHTATRSVVGGTKGAPPIAIDDVYGQCFLSEPNIRPPVEREPKAMFDKDMEINEVIIYLNGGLHATKDKVCEDFVRHMFESSVIFFPRDASSKPQEFRDLLKQHGGTEELPQLWIGKKLIGSGAELKDFDRVWELCAPARRPWPREGSYRNGFYNRYGEKDSTKVFGVQ